MAFFTTRKAILCIAKQYGIEPSMFERYFPFLGTLRLIDRIVEKMNPEIVENDEKYFSWWERELSKFK